MISQEIKDIAEKIGQYFLAKNSNDYKAAAEEIERIRINRLETNSDDDTLIIECSRPGLLIGKRGEQVAFLEDHLLMVIKIEETKEHLLDYLIPQKPLEWEEEYSYWEEES